MSHPNQSSRLQLNIEGLVQGVGFRPFVFNLATGLHLTGFVGNTLSGVTIEVEGQPDQVSLFLSRLKTNKPPLARYDSLTQKTIPVQHDAGFSIKQSSVDGSGHSLILPDISMCPDCLADIQIPHTRRSGYPFTNCTNCGPRFSIIDELPYDRPHTTMKSFTLCPACRQEYQDPHDRRFHAQPTACSVCGPQLSLIDSAGNQMPSTDIIGEMAKKLKNGCIIAIKGLGGFQLLADATNESAVSALRDRKHRPDKPLAVMCTDLSMARQYAQVNLTAAKLLQSPQSPIVILPKKRRSPLAPAIAPDTSTVGILLPYTPLHYLILSAANRPLVCTSGNLSGEAIIIEADEAVAKLKGIADYFLIHNRPIKRHMDDSVVRLNHRQPIMMRRARGYVPLPLFSKSKLPPLLAVGGQQKNTIAVSSGNRIIVSQHLGDLESPQILNRLQHTITDFLDVFGIIPKAIACDAHPDYESTRLAATIGIPIIPVFHHQAHLEACLLDNGMTDETVLGVTWDGTGLGPDGTIWGGEFLLRSPQSTRRVAWLKPFSLWGGEVAVRQPRRIALALLYELNGLDAFRHPWTINHFTPTELQGLKNQVTQKINLQTTTSMGRLFDGVAALIGLKDVVTYEGQAAMMLEDRAASANTGYPFIYRGGVIDWRPMVEAILAETDPSMAAGKFHQTLAHIITKVARETEMGTVALTGGCFQNLRLTGLTTSLLSEKGFRVLCHQELPPNDGNLSAGQIVIAGKQVCA